MENLLKKLGLKKEKPILRETTLTNKDLVHLSHKFNTLFLVRDGHFYRIKEWFSEINHSNPKVSLKYMYETTKPFLKELQPDELQPYKELRSSL